MKTKIYIMLLFSFVFTQYDWDDNGVSVRQGIHIEWQRTGDANSDECSNLDGDDGDCGSDSVYGDINGDTAVNVVDIVNLVNWIFSDDMPYSCVADINGDGSINVVDVVNLVNLILSN